MPLFNSGNGYMPAGPQGGRIISGLPNSSLPGMVNAREAERARRQVAGSPPPFPPVTPEIQCVLDYLIRGMCDCLIEEFRNTQIHARRPSHIDPPLNGICFDRHRGTGDAASPDPPFPLPFVGPGGPFTTVLDFTVGQTQRGILNFWGVAVDPVAANPGIEWIMFVNGRTVSPFDSNHGSMIAGGQSWFGPPFTLISPDRDLCVHLHPNDLVELQARNSFGGGPVSVAARMGGWVYMPTIQTADETVRATMTDQR